MHSGQREAILVVYKTSVNLELFPLQVWAAVCQSWSAGIQEWAVPAHWWSLRRPGPALRVTSVSLWTATRVPLPAAPMAIPCLYHSIWELTGNQHIPHMALSLAIATWLGKSLHMSTDDFLTLFIYWGGVKIVILEQSGCDCYGFL